jgi:excisionase family DNA binding protein
MTHDMTRQDGDMPTQDYDMTTSGHVTVEEAARLLDVSVDAVRKRIERGTLSSEKVGKTRYVFLDDIMIQQDADRARHDSGPEADRTQHDTDMTALVASMQDQIDTLKQKLQDRKEEARRKDAILMTMAQRIPELEAPREESASPEAREGHVTASEEADKGKAPSEKAPSEQQEPSQRGERSWWRAFFGLE